MNSKNTLPARGVSMALMVDGLAVPSFNPRPTTHDPRPC